MTQRSGIPFATQVAGDVYSSFVRLNNVISKNDGIRSFSILTNNCYDSDQGFYDDQQTHIRITNSLHDINQISQTYLRMTFEAVVSVDTNLAANSVFTKAKPTYNLYFLGWKNANECLKQLEVENMNIDTNYLQTECAKEGFCYSTYKPREEKMSNRYVHSRYEDVRCGKDGVCGVYFGYRGTGANNGAVLEDKKPTNAIYNASTDVIGHSEFTVQNIQVVLPITDILAFQCFEDFPSGLGDIVLKIFLNKDSMVWTQVDPFEYAKQELLYFNNSDLDDGFFTASSATIGQSYNHRFFQVGESGKCVTNMSDAPVLTLADRKFSVKTLKCVRMQCECYGYNVTQECKRQLVSLFTPSNPYTIPAQQIDVKYFANKVDQNQYDNDFTYALHNVTDFVIVFPKNSTNVTTFLNPMIEEIQLRVDGKLYPNQPFEKSWDHRFYMAMMLASDFQSFYQADDEYVNSFLIPRKNEVNCPTDMTSFIMTMQAERNSGGFFFDGLETGNQNVNISLRFQRSKDWEYSTNCPPQVWFTRDTYWTVDNEQGLRYWKTGTPATYSSADDAVGEIQIREPAKSPIGRAPRRFPGAKPVIRNNYVESNMEQAQSDFAR